MVLITGVAGFIGYHTAKTCLDRNMRVIGVDNLNDYYDVELKKKRLKLLTHPNFIFHKTDIENFNEMNHIFDKYDIHNVIHLAARAGVRHSIDDPYKYLRTNTIGTLNILELMKKHNKKQLVMGSTSSLYGNNTFPFMENQKDDSISPYAATKGAAEQLAFSYAHLYNINIAILRFFTVYGKLGRPDMSYYKFIEGIKNGKEITVYGNGEQQRDFTYIDDVVQAIIKSFIYTGCDIINIGTGQIISINELVQKLEKLLNKKAIIKQEAMHNADMLVTQACNKKALDLLSWSPLYNIDDGLKKTLEEQND
jgi:nucleoside-diphosphate-sugar epimerase